MQMLRMTRFIFMVHLAQLPVGVAFLLLGFACLRLLDGRRRGLTGRRMEPGVMVG